VGNIAYYGIIIKFGLRLEQGLGYSYLMSEVAVEQFPRLTVLERKSSIERLNDEVYKELLDWMENDLPERYLQIRSSLLSIKKGKQYSKDSVNVLKVDSAVDCHAEKATLSRDLARVLNIFTIDGVSDKYEKKVYDLLLNTENPSSFVNKLGNDRDNEMYGFLKGCIGGLTLIHLLKEIDPDNYKNLSISVAATDAWVDVLQKTDFIVEKENEVLLIQLKCGDTIVIKEAYDNFDSNLKGNPNALNILEDRYDIADTYGYYKEDMEKNEVGKKVGEKTG